jgi:hypothetical protein
MNCKAEYILPDAIQASRSGKRSLEQCCETDVPLRRKMWDNTSRKYEYKYISRDTTKSLGSGMATLDKPSLMSLVGTVQEVVCA